MTITCACWRCTGKAHDDGTIHGHIAWTMGDTTPLADILIARGRTQLDPLTVEEPWSWSCPRCTASLPRSAIRAHLDDHDARPEAVIVWLALAVGIAVAVVAAVVVTRG